MEVRTTSPDIRVSGGALLPMKGVWIFSRGKSRGWDESALSQWSRHRRCMCYIVFIIPLDAISWTGIGPHGPLARRPAEMCKCHWDLCASSSSYHTALHPWYEDVPECAEGARVHALRRHPAAAVRHARQGILLGERVDMRGKASCVLGRGCS